VVIPIHDRNPVHRTPVVTYALLLVNIGVFLFLPIGLSSLDGISVAEVCATDAYLREYAAVPRELTTGEPLPPQQTVIETDRGRVECPTVDVSDKSPFLSVLTAMFLHGGWAHLLGNMLFLFVFGNNVEDRLGRLRFLLFYMGCGYVATYFFAFTNPSSTATLVGASGAIAGVLGAYLWMFPRARIWSLVPFFFFIPFRLPAWLVLGFWFVLQWLYFRGAGMAGGDVAYAAHVAGFVAGFLGAILIRGRRPPARAEPPYPYRR